jgi:hypothetical protein
MFATTGRNPRRASMMTITGREANLLLFALDNYLATDHDGKIRRTADEFTMKQAQDLRDRLFAAHQHPKSMDPE